MISQCWVILFLASILFALSNSATISYCCPQNSVLEKGECVSTDNYFKSQNLSLSQFSFSIYLPNCHEDKVLETIERSELISEGDPDYDYVDVTAITNSGFLRYEEAYYSPLEYCLMSITDHSLTFRICKPKCTEGQTCVRKCCLLSETLEFKTTASGIITQACVPAAPAQWQPVVYKNLELPFGAGNSNSLVHIQVEGTGEWNMSECREIAKYTYKGSLRSDFRLLPSGDLMYREMYTSWEKLTGKFCIDGESKDGQYSGYENDTIVLYCFPHSKATQGADYQLGKLYYSIMLISVVFLILTIIVYLILWDKHTIHGYSLLSYFVSLLLMESALVASFVMSEQSVTKGNNVLISKKCLAVSIIAHFAFIYAFAWMTVVNYDLWCTFRNLKSTLTSHKGVKKYCQYFFFATILPLTIVGVGLVLDLLFGANMPYERSLTLPDYGKRKCYISNPGARLPYVVGPISVLLLVNFFFFITTIMSLKQSSDVSKLTRNNGPNKRQSVALIAKLICVMGVPWILEVISSVETLATWFDVGSNAVPWYWVLFDIINHLQGVIIFIIFICKRDILNSIRSRILCLDRICKRCSPHFGCYKFGSRGSKNTDTMTLDSENDGHLLPNHSTNTKSTKLESMRGTTKSGAVDHKAECKNEETTKV